MNVLIVSRFHFNEMESDSLLNELSRVTGKDYRGASVSQVEPNKFSLFKVEEADENVVFGHDVSFESADIYRTTRDENDADTHIFYPSRLSFNPDVTHPEDEPDWLIDELMELPKEPVYDWEKELAEKAGQLEVEDEIEDE